MLTELRAKGNRSKATNGDTNGQKFEASNKMGQQGLVEITKRFKLFLFSQRVSQSDEVYAALRLDNRVVATTDCKSMGKDCWNQMFTIDLERARELEIEVYYRDSRSMCAFVVIRIGDYIGSSITHQKLLNLEPQGQLFVEVNWLRLVI